MKNKIWFLYAIPCVLIIAFVIGGFSIREKYFPNAPTMEKPEKNEIISGSAYAYPGTMGAVIELSAEDWGNFLILIDGSTPTRIQSINDLPTVSPYYEVELKTDNRVYAYFVYEEGEQVLIEMPYTGVYRADRELLDWVARITV